MSAAIEAKGTVHVISNGRPVFVHRDVPVCELDAVVSEIEKDPRCRAYVERRPEGNMLPDGTTNQSR